MFDIIDYFNIYKIIGPIDVLIYSFWPSYLAIYIAIIIVYI